MQLKLLNQRTGCAASRVSRRLAVMPRAAVGASPAEHGPSHQHLELPPPGHVNRRLLLAMGAWLIIPVPPTQVKPARAEEAAPAEVTYKTLNGYAQPPDTYLGYADRTSNIPAKYSIQYPSDWVVQIPSKTEKSTMGMDIRVHHKKNDDLEAFVIALSGPDYAGVQLSPDPVKQLTTMATSDYELRDAITEKVSLQSSARTVKGVKFYDYDLESQDRHYLSTMTVGPDGTMYALMVKAPAGRLFARNEPVLRKIAESFTLL
mmetsp:Transcript_25172/g.63883  ORF Transcript_25172/g.63883 Transcript_25172/m.63883 type:complete len:261 (-) Transcript_25172:836-1618(-)